MKKSLKLFFVMALVGLFSTAFAQPEKGAKIEFVSDVHDYGNIEFGADGNCTFVFKNTGTESLIIVEAKPSCGCTIPDWPRDPIAPGETAVISVNYNTKKAGAIAKTVTIVSNAVNDPNKVLRIKGNVAPEPPAKLVPENKTGPVK
jgi:Protein of unknown function (DUF1573)